MVAGNDRQLLWRGMLGDQMLDHRISVIKLIGVQHEDILDTISVRFGQRRAMGRVKNDRRTFGDLNTCKQGNLIEQSVTRLMQHIAGGRRCLEAALKDQIVAVNNSVHRTLN